VSLFLDSANLDEIRSAMELGIYSGVTTNPALLSGIAPSEQLEHLGEIARVCRRSLYVQVQHRSPEEMERQALTLVEIAPGRTIIKVPMSPEGLKAAQLLTLKGVPVCLTAVFSPLQVYAAALAGAHSAAIYVGRIEKRGEEGLAVLRQSLAMLEAGNLPTRVLAASIPDASTLAAILSLGDLDATIPFKLHQELLDHPGTREALEQFAGGPPED